MIATIQIHLTEGLTPQESGVFVDESNERHVPVDTVVYEALREKAQKMIKRRAAEAARAADRPNLLGIRKPEAQPA